MIPARTLVVAGLLVSLAGGCASDPNAARAQASPGWTSASPFPDTVRTIAIPIAANDSFVRGVEFDLTDAIIKEVEARTPYKVTTSTRADSILVAHIRKVELDQLSKSRLTGLGEEVLLGVTIDFEWKDLTTDATLVERRSFTGHGLFVPSAPTSERIELGRMAVVEQLARDVVNEMQGAW